MGWMIWAGIVFLALGAFLFFRPDLVWKLTEQWKSYRADEPSELYVISTKVGGVAFALCGVAAVVPPFCFTVNKPCPGKEGNTTC